MTLTLVGSLLVGLPTPAMADPPLPAGATKNPPTQALGAVQAKAAASTQSTQGKRAPDPEPEKPRHPVAKLGPIDAKDWYPTADTPGRDASVPTGFVEGKSVEDVSARTTNSTEFVNPDGSRTRRMYEGLTYVPDAAGKLTDLDTTLRKDGTDGRLKAKATLSPATFASDAGKPDVARLDLGDGVSLGFGVEGAAAVPVSPAGDVAIYRGVRKDADLELSTTALGMNENIVLWSAAAPTTWTFPLRTLGATPVWDEASGSIQFVDRRGNLAAVIPPGLMVDSSFDPLTGGQTSSTGVRYTLVPQGPGWALRVDLDQKWLADPARRFPVIVDPTFNPPVDADDTYVMNNTNQNNSANGDLLIGTWNSGGEKAASFLHFNLAPLASTFITGASLNLYDYWSWSCNAAPASVHKVTQSWAGSTTTTWPGPSYEATPLQTSSFAYGYSACPTTGWGSWALPADRVNAWVHGTESWYGLTVRASETNSTGWKRFRSTNYGSLQPRLDVTYVTTPPTVIAIYPSPNGTVDTISPTLWAHATDPNNLPTRLKFHVCNGTPEAPVNCNDSAWLSQAFFTVPASWLSGWGKDSWWQVNVDNGSTQTGPLGPFWFTPVLNQPPVTSHLAGADDSSEIPGVNPLVGNYSTAVTDAKATVAGPALSVRRTYNSQDIRTNGAFGPGWSTPWDQKVVQDTDGSGNVVVTLESGLEMRFGQNAGGSYAPPQGVNLDLVYASATSTWTLRDASGTRKEFLYDAPSGVARLTKVTDGDGRTQTLTYTSGQLSRVTDDASGRKLTVTWTGGRISSVAADPPASGQTAPTWTYAYTSGRLTSVCTPLGAQACTTYTYDPSSHYRSLILDDGPSGYWPLGEASGTTAANLAARSPGDLDATYASVTLGATGALTGSPDNAATFSAAGGSRLTLPNDVTNTAVREAMELWFKAASGATGILFSQQSTPIGSSPGNFVPPLYVGTDGKLRGEFWNAAGGSQLMGSTVRVDDNVWHHAVISANVNDQRLYLDGVQIGAITGQTIDQLNMSYAYLGTGTGGWPATTAGEMRFTGQIDEAAYYRHPLTPTQVAAHYNARAGTARLKTVVEPGNFTATTVTYDHATGRVTALTDRNGATWTLTAPTLVTDRREVTVSSGQRGPIVYRYDTQRNGRITERTEANATRRWIYDDAGFGFLSKVYDENNNLTSFVTDARGNVTERRTCRVAGDPPTDCHSQYFGYYYNPDDKLDPRNDVQLWSTDGRATGPTDTTVRTTRTIDSGARVTSVTYPKPNGQTNNPTESFTYTGVGLPAPAYTQTTQAQAFLAGTTAFNGVPNQYGQTATARLTLPFPFVYYGQTYQQISVVPDNGIVSFDHLPDLYCCGATVIPDKEGTNNALYPFQEQFGFDPSPSGTYMGTFGTAPNRQFVIEWRNVGFRWLSAGERFSFEVVLNENGTIAFNYAGIDAAREQAGGDVMGLESPGGFEAVPYSPGPAGLSSGSAVIFTPYAGYVPRWQTYAVSTATRTFTPANGTVLPITYSPNWASFTAPFPIKLYGRSFTSGWACVGGYVSFNATPGSFCGLPAGLPQDDVANAVAMPFGASFGFDIYSGTSTLRTATTGTAPNRQFIVEWRNVYNPNDSNERFDAEVVFAESGEISFNYNNIGSGTYERGGSAVVGLENADATLGQEASSLQPVLATNRAVIFTPLTPGTLPYLPIPVGPTGLVSTHTSVTGGVTHNTYNNAGDLLTSVDPVGLVTTNTYDALGRIATTRQSGTVDGQPVDYGTTSYTYNGLSEPLTVTAPGILNPVTGVTHTLATTYTYDNSGRPTRQVLSDATGGDPSRTTIIGYDTAGRQTSLTTSDGGITNQSWDQAGNMTQTTLPSGLVLRLAYDFAHRMTTKTAVGGTGIDAMNPASTTDVVLEANSFDPVGRLSSSTDSMGRTTFFTYYADNLLNTTARDRAGSTPDLVVESRVYDGAGHVTQQTTPGPTTAGVITTATYDPAGNVVNQAFDPTGLNRTTTFQYTADSQVTSAASTGAASPGRTESTGATYDLGGRVVTSSVDTHVTTVRRDPRGLVTAQTDPTAATTYFAYDLAGLPLTMTAPPRAVWVGGVQQSSVSPVSTVGRNAFGEVTQQRDPNGNVTAAAYDGMGQPTSVTLPAYTPPGGTALTSTASKTYNTQGLPVTETDRLGNVTSYTYDKFGRTLTRTLPDPDGTGPKAAPVWNYLYTRTGEMRKSTSPTGAQTLATFDELGRQITGTESEAGASIFYTTTFGYDDAGNRTTETTALNHATTTTFNAAGEPLRVTDPTGRFAESTYDMAGRVLSTARGQGSTYVSPVTTAVYDTSGFTTSTSDCTVTATGTCGTVLRSDSTTYDNVGRPLSHTSGEFRTTTYTYDASGHVTSAGQTYASWFWPLNISLQLGYDAAGNRTNMVDPNGNTTVYTYNPWNLPESTIEPTTVAHPAAVDRTWTTSYDAAGHPVRDLLPGGVNRNRTFDKLGRLTGETGAGATTTARTLDYDASDHLVSASSPAGNLSFGWTDRGLLASANGYGGAASYTYDGEANLTARTDAAGSSAFGYDAAGRITSMSDPLTGVSMSNVYDTAGRWSTSTYGGSGASIAVTYDDLGRTASESLRRPDATTAASITYAYDKDNLLTGKTTTGLTGAGSNTFMYDGAGRIMYWVGPDGTTTTYGYDNSGNRISIANAAGTRTSTFDARNRLLTTTGAGAPTDTYVWNPRGDLTSSVQNGQTNTYTFDAFDRITQVARTAGPTLAYDYDGLDRAAKRNGLNFGYHDLSNDAVITPAAAGETKFMRDPWGGVVSSKTGTGTATAALVDSAHGDQVATLNPATGNTVATAGYDPWGKPSGTALPLGFQGGYTDPDVGLVDAAARWYSPGQGSFVSRDSVTLAPAPLAQANRYQYGNDSPLVMRDLDGHRPTCDSEDGGGSRDCTDKQLEDEGYYKDRKSTTPDYKPSSTPPADMTDAQQQAQIDVDRLQADLDEQNRTANKSFMDVLIDVGATMILDFLGVNDFIDCFTKGDVGACVSTLLNVIPWGKLFKIGKDIVKAAYRAWEGWKVFKRVTEAARAAVKAVSRKLDDAKSALERLLKKADDGCNSFDPDTPVVMADGSTKPIKDVQLGDEVLATDPETGQTSARTVTALHVNQDTDLTDLVVVHDGVESTIHTTQHHPFWDVTAHAWIDAGSLTAGDELSGSVTVVAVENHTGSTQMDNLTVADVHTYYIVSGDDQILVHNTACKIPNGGPTPPEVPSNGWRQTAKQVGKEMAKDAAVSAALSGYAEIVVNGVTKAQGPNPNATGDFVGAVVGGAVGGIIGGRMGKRNPIMGGVVGGLFAGLVTGSISQSMSSGGFNYGQVGVNVGAGAGFGLASGIARKRGFGGLVIVATDFVGELYN